MEKLKKYILHIFFILFWCIALVCCVNNIQQRFGTEEVIMISAGYLLLSLAITSFVKEKTYSLIFGFSNFPLVVGWIIVTILMLFTSASGYIGLLSPLAAELWIRFTIAFAGVAVVNSIQLFILKYFSEKGFLFIKNWKVFIIILLAMLILFSVFFQPLFINGRFWG